MARTILLIDGDQYLHRGCAATERETSWDDENHILLSNEEEAYDTVSTRIRHLIDRFGDDVVLCWSGDNKCFRYDIDPTYKQNRKGARKPMCFYDVRTRLMADYKSVQLEGIEADDVMGVLATKPGKDEKIIIARDKDMLGIPGKLYDGSKFHQITVEQADRWHMYQTLVGDAADGYKGCPGVGPKKAEKLLTQNGDMGDTSPRPDQLWGRVLEAFVSAGLTEEHALTQARLARILRWSDWDSKAKKPILWTPK